MHSHSSLSAPHSAPTETISAKWRTILVGLVMAMGAWGIEPVLAMVLHRRIGGIRLRIERMILRFQAGELWRMKPRAAVKAESASRKQPELRLPREYGWLLKAGKHHAAYFTSQLQTVLSTPEMTEMLAASPQARRVLRPLCRALAVEFPWTVDQPRAERPPKPRKPRPKPEPFRIPLPRGLLARARKYKDLDEAIKLKHELVLKMAKTRLR